MLPEGGETGSSKLAVAALAATTFAFITIRLAYLLVREPFFDELFTLWLSRRGLSAIFAAIALDSGPPLYYLITALASSLDDSLAILRVVSMLCGAIGLAAIVMARLPVRIESVALLLLTILPLHVHFSTEARAYALCGSAVGLAAVALHRWRTTGGRRTLAIATLGLLVAAYTHYYGVLAFPLIVVAALVPAASLNRLHAHRKRDAIAATVALGLFYVPGFLLASLQPAAAHAWMADAPFPLLSAFRQLPVAGDFPLAVMAAPPSIVQWISIAVVFGLLGVMLPKRSTWWWAAATLTPLAVSSVLVAAGIHAYFPARFESMLLVPFVIWLSVALSELKPALRRFAVIAILTLAMITLGYASTVHSGGIVDPYRQSANVTSEVAGKGLVVVSGLSYLELVNARGRDAQIIALPLEQAAHPGWRAVPDAARLEHEVAQLASAHERIFWLGEAGSPEMRAMTRRFALKPLYRNGPIVLLYGRRR